jgi:broad specificity phosphatase PhoE
VAEPAPRLRLVVHGATAAASDLVFGDQGLLRHPEAVEGRGERVGTWCSATEPVCRQTLAALGEVGAVLPSLAGPGFGTWAGRPLVDVAAADPTGLQAWLTDPDARPHDGETLTELVRRMVGVLDDRTWPAGLSALVVTPLAARALTVAALGAPATVVLALDVGYGGRVLLSRSGSRWRLQELLRHPAS